MKRFDKKEYNNARERIRAFIKTNNRLPNSCIIKNQDGEPIQLLKEEYCGLFEGYMHFCLKNNREPNYLTLNCRAETPLIVNLQDDKYSCCPASFLMCMMFLFDYKSESEVKRLLGTTVDGTSPDKLVNNARRLGYKVKRIPREFKFVKMALDEYKPVIMHIQTQPATCLGFEHDYGHYIMCYKAKDNNYYVICPTRGMKTCNYLTLNRATKGRDIGYYSVEIL